MLSCIAMTPKGDSAYSCAKLDFLKISMIELRAYTERTGETGNAVAQQRRQM